MAKLIPMDKLTTLQSASAVKAVADEALKIHEEQSVAALINQAANAGQHSVTCNHILSEEIKKTLKAQGYKLTKDNRAADPDRAWVIAGF